MSTVPRFANFGELRCTLSIHGIDLPRHRFGRRYHVVSIAPERKQLLW
jgi:hypothetical protein